jgi:hypothetical protein
MKIFFRNRGLEIGAAGSVGDDRLFGLVFDVVFQGCVYR